MLPAGRTGQVSPGRRESVSTHGSGLGSSVRVFLRARPRRHAAPSRLRVFAGARSAIPQACGGDGPSGWPPADLAFCWPFATRSSCGKVTHRKLQRTCRPLPSAKARAFGLSVWGCLGPRGELGSRMISPGALDFRLRPSVGTWLQPARQEREDHGPSCCQSQRCRRTGPSSVQNGPQEPEEPPRDASTSARLGEEACRSSPHVRSSSGKRL